MSLTIQLVFVHKIFGAVMWIFHDQSPLMYVEVESYMSLAAAVSLPDFGRILNVFSEQVYSDCATVIYIEVESCLSLHG